MRTAWDWPGSDLRNVDCLCIACDLLNCVISRCRCRGPSANFSMIKVDPAIDLDGPQLDYAARHPHMLRYEIGAANNWGPKGHFWQLPVQLWPYLVSPVYNYVPGSDTPAGAPPQTGIWQSNQVVLSPLNSTAIDARGWRCTHGGRPGVSSQRQLLATRLQSFLAVRY